MNVQIGSGRVRLPGFTNVDIRPLDETDVIGHAGDLSGLADGSVKLLFSHALFEHVFLAHQGAVLAEWRRVLAADGLLVCLGLPDFASIARLYLDRAEGVVGDRFDLFNVYRYTHGDPEHAASEGDWPAWRPDRRPDAAPPGWLPQLHKSLFDAGYLQSLFEAAGLPPTIFRYAFPGERHALNLGVMVDRSRGPGGCPVVEGLRRIPEIGRFVALDGVVVEHPGPLAEGLLARSAIRPAPPRRSFASRAWGRATRAIRGGRPW